MYSYSDNSNIVNECLRNHDGKQNSNLETKYIINGTQYKNIIKNLDNSQVKLVEDTTLFRGFKDNVNDFYQVNQSSIVVLLLQVLIKMLESSMLQKRELFWKLMLLKEIKEFI